MGKQRRKTPNFHKSWLTGFLAAFMGYDQYGGYSQPMRISSGPKPRKIYKNPGIGEAARRRRQILKGQLKVENGLEVGASSETTGYPFMEDAVQ